MIRLAKPYIPARAIRAAVSVLKGGDLVQGERVLEFERRLAEFLSVRHVVLVSSGTAALHLSLLALGVGPGDEVLVPAFTYPATANAVEVTGARCVFVDISLEDFCLDPRGLASAATGKTRAILPVHEFGQSADMGPILAFARKRSLRIIEDAACALGAEYEGRKVGTFGAAGCFSLHPRKAITTGEGGAVVTNDGRIAEKVRALRNHGIVVRAGKPEFLYPGFNQRMTEFQAAIGLPQLERLESLIRYRERLARLYDSALAGVQGMSTPARLTFRRMVYQTYHILLDDHFDRDVVIRRLRKDGVETNLGAYAVPQLAHYRAKVRASGRAYPNATRAMRQGLALPMGHHVRPQDIPVITNMLRAALEP